MRPCCGTCRAQTVWRCAGTRDHEGKKEVREVNVIEDPWRQSATKRRKGSTRESGKMRRKSEPRTVWDCGAQCTQEQGGSVLVTGVPSCHLELLSTASSHSQRPGKSPSRCALLAQVSSSSSWAGAKAILTESLPLNLLQQGLMGCTEAPLPTASSIFITMIALHSQKIGLPGFTTFNRYSMWLCVILAREITHILQAGGSLILILSNSGVCLLTNYHFLL